MMGEAKASLLLVGVILNEKSPRGEFGMILDGSIILNRIS